MAMVLASPEKSRALATSVLPSWLDALVRQRCPNVCSTQESPKAAQLGNLLEKKKKDRGQDVRMGTRVCAERVCAHMDARAGVLAEWIVISSAGSIGSRVPERAGSA